MSIYYSLIKGTLKGAYLHRLKKTRFLIEILGEKRLIERIFSGKIHGRFVGKQILFETFLKPKGLAYILHQRITLEEDSRYRKEKPSRAPNEIIETRNILFRAPKSNYLAVPNY